MDTAIVILAAGLGKRMKSDKAKVLHKVLGKPMILYVVEASEKVVGNNVVVVVGNQAEAVKHAVSQHHTVLFAFQDKQLGTGHAVSCAMPVVPESVEHIIVLCGDVPLIRQETVWQFWEKYKSENRDVSVLAVNADNPTGYGRVIVNADGDVSGIVEEKDASDEQRQIKLINTGIYCVRKSFLDKALNQLKPDNSQGEYYLTDIIAIAHREGKSIGVMVGQDTDEFIGVNTLEHLAAAEEKMRGVSE
jgi:UDP-N-acetylglucosamine diphosphorylase/glucosamine-1-phosphate N-acetyltransferase